MGDRVEDTDAVQLRRAGNGSLLPRETLERLSQSLGRVGVLEVDLVDGGLGAGAENTDIGDRELDVSVDPGQNVAETRTDLALISPNTANLLQNHAAELPKKKQRKC